MSDPRSTPDSKVKDFEKPSRIKGSVVNLRRSPDGPRDRQLIYGDAVTHLGTVDAWAYIQSVKDGYCGYVRKDLISSQIPDPTHWMAAPASTAYAEPNIKSRDLSVLTFGAQLHVSNVVNDLADTEIGFVPMTHLRPLAERFDDPAAVAALFLGTPYLWGGNSRQGIDCSGLVQAALLACDIPCPGDSDQQMSLGNDASGYQRNDLLFWKGHVALVHDPQTIIHANAHAMAVTYEPITTALNRIAAAGDGPMTAHRRLAPCSGSKSSSSKS